MGVRRGEGMRRVTGIALVLGMAAALAVVPAAQAETGEEFCTRRVLVDYEAPLDGLPDIREPPQSGQLPFGPSRLYLSPEARSFPGPGQAEGIVIEGDPIRYQLSLTGAAFGNKRLPWDVESRMVRINRPGEDLRIVKHRRERVGLVVAPWQGEPGRPRKIGFKRSPRPGLYRYDLLFRDSAGDLLGHYHQHYLVLERSEDVRLTLNGSAFRAGETIRGRLDNYGTEPLFYGVAFWLERAGPTGWEFVSLSDLLGKRIGFILIGLVLNRGASDDCSAGLTIPETMTPGLWRISKSVDMPAGGRNPFERRTRTISSEFTVLPPP